MKWCLSTLLVALGVIANSGCDEKVTCLYDGVEFRPGDNHADGCNGCTCQEDGDIGCSLLGCTPYEDIDLTEYYAPCQKGVSPTCTYPYVCTTEPGQSPNLSDGVCLVTCQTEQCKNLESMPVCSNLNPDPDSSPVFRCTPN